MEENSITEVKNDDSIENSGDAMEQQGEATEEQFTDSNKVEPSENKPQQDNRANARRRIEERERKKDQERLKEEARYEAIRDIVKKNPYNDQPLTDKEDVKVYLDMKEIADKGGDPNLEYAKYVSEKNRRAEEERVRVAQEQERARENIEEFSKKYPDIKVESLLEDADFQDYAEGKGGTLTELYERYVDFTSKYTSQVNAKAQQIVANASTTPGSLSSGGSDEKTYFTPEEVQKMDRATYVKNRENIEKSRAKW